MKNWIKILLPIIGFAYCFAFLEINIPGGVHQTWNDEYDTYIVTQNNTDAHSVNQSVDLNSTNLAVLNSRSVVPIILIALFLLFIPFFILFYNSSGLYLKNCTFLI
jgi:hypothetical protein